MKQSDNLKKEHKELLLKAQYTLKEEEGDNAEIIQAIFDEADKVKAKIKQAEYVENELDLGEFVPAGQHISPAMSGYIEKMVSTSVAKDTEEDLVGYELVKKHLSTKAYKRAFDIYSRKGDREMTTKHPALFQELNTKVLNTYIGDQGGFLVPGEMSKLMIEERAAITELLNFVTTVQTSSNPYKANRVEGSTGAEQDIWPNGIRVFPLNEVKGDREGESEPRFGTLDIVVNDFGMQTLLSRNLIDDSEFNLESWLPRNFGIAQGLDAEMRVIVGTGVGQPLGVLNDSAVIGDSSLVVDGAAVNILSPEDFINVKYALPNQYRRSPNVGWTMNSQSVRDIRLMEDGQGNFLWQPNYQLGQPETLCGFPILESEFMPDVLPTGAESYPVLFGDWSNYHVVERKSLQIQVLREHYASQWKVGYLGHYRLGGQVVQPRGFRVLKIST